MRPAGTSTSSATRGPTACATPTAPTRGGAWSRSSGGWTRRTCSGTTSTSIPAGRAKAVTGLDDIASGRLILGLGSGAAGFAATMTRRTPWDRRERTARFAEYVHLTDLLLTQPVTTFEGRYYVAREVHSHPLC